jgi:glutamate racemase
LRIGIFDSGIGGLTVFHAIRRAMPSHDLLYLGDTARIPYGTRSPLTVQRYSFRVASWLYDQGVDALVIACNTATTHALDGLAAAGERVGLPVFGVIEPGVEAALAASRGGGIGVIGTPGTITGAAYQNALRRRRPDLPVYGVACPLFVSLVEEGWLRGEVPRLVAETYLGHLRGKIETLILGCTHYPLLREVIGEVLPGVSLVDSAESTAHALGDRFPAAPTPMGQRGTTRFAVTDNVERFQQVGALFLGEVPSPVSWVDLPAAHAPFEPPGGEP